jgi:predicted dehydrogenase
MSKVSRRDFMAATTAAGIGLVAAPSMVHAQTGRDTIRVGLIGCGGRGTGAAVNCFQSSKGIEIWAMGDLFEDRLTGSANYIKEQTKDSFKVTDDRKFVGWDAYQKVIGTDCDMVILATPPGFRPIHLAAAIDGGKHVFMEKPVATDAPGIRSVFASSDKAAAKGLAIVSGTQRRHGLDYNATIQRIHDGQIGDISALYVYWNQGGLWMNPREEKWTDMEWQLRNWLYFTWLSGDHICEQHIHNIDVGNWAMQKHPVKATSLAGRQVRTDPAYGHIFDHFATEYEYDNGVKMLSMCRQIDGTASRVSESVVGTKGSSNCANSIKGEKPWKFEGDSPDHYMLEHKDLIASIRAGKPLNEGRRVAESTLTAIMGRMAAYTGQEISWEQALASTEVLAPDHFEFGHLSVPPVAVPGVTKLV